MGELKAGDALEVGDVAGHEGCARLEADTSLHRIADVDRLAAPPQLAEQRAPAQSGLSRQRQQRRGKEGVHGPWVLAVGAPERQLESGDSRDPIADPLDQSPDQILPGPAPRR